MTIKISNIDDAWPALHQASWYGDYTEVKRLLQDGVSVREVDDEGETALHQAAWQGHTDITISLLDAAADPNSKDGNGQTPLHQAATNGFKEIVCLLLAGGADPSVKDGHRRKPHSLAEQNFHHSTADILRQREIHFDGQEVVSNTDKIPSTILPALSLDPSVIPYLPLHQCMSMSNEPYGKASFSTTSKVKVHLHSGETKLYFMKIGWDGRAFTDEFESLSAIHKAVPSLCPRPLAHAKLTKSEGYFLLTEFIDMTATDHLQSSGSSLAQKLAQLHSTPVPTSTRKFPNPVYGFHVPTYVGSTLRLNTRTPSWARFFTECRLRPAWRTMRRIHGTDTELQFLFGRVIQEVVPRLLRPGHLGGKEGIKPALVHGELWSGNKTRGSVGGKSGVEDVVFDPASFYAHSEYELGMMRMFGGFLSGFFKEYHRLMPKTEPRVEYRGRLELYQL
ncbi:MAG: hypothetical protein L6R38_005916 [Xanthoria sp. 2 TBL-2021]|nr:MAG: hypothetical protein L6R38_005916 [Xanthoria sp. 2 TBL-2021]